VQGEDRQGKRGRSLSTTLADVFRRKRGKKNDEAENGDGDDGR
jgi:hypothetical protein